MTIFSPLSGSPDPSYLVWMGFKRRQGMAAVGGGVRTKATSPIIRREWGSIEVR